MRDIKLTGLRKSYGETEVVHGIDLEIADGELIVFVGPSGCGKSTLLRMIAGLESITSGDLHIGGQRANELAPGDRDVSMVFQNYALYPHMTVRENMAFGLENLKVPRAEITRRIAWAAKLLQMEPLLERQPRRMSGGQQQRAAIGRAIVRDPKVFLFDEPLSNLDAALRLQMRVEIAELHQRLDATMVYVTHDQVEAMTLADRIVVLRDGTIEQVGTPREIYEDPANAFVAGFIGSPSINLLEGQARGGQFNSQGLDIGMSVPDGTATVGIRPDCVQVVDQGVPATITLVEYLGDELVVHMEVGQGKPLVAKVSRRMHLHNAQSVHLQFDPSGVRFFGKDGTRLEAQS